MPRRTRYKTRKLRKAKKTRKIRKGGSNPMPPTEKELLDLHEIINYHLGYFSGRIKTEDLYRVQPLREMSHLTLALIKPTGIDYTPKELSNYIIEMEVQLEIWKIYSSNYKGKIKQEMDNLTDLMKTKVSMLQPVVPEIDRSNLLRRQSSDSLLDPMSRQSSMGSRQNSIDTNPLNSPLFIEGVQHLKNSKKKMKKVFDFLNGRIGPNDPVVTLLRSSIKSAETLLEKMKTHTFDKEDSLVYMSSLVDLENAIYTSKQFGNRWSILIEARDEMRQADVLLPPSQANMLPWPPPQEHVPPASNLNFHPTSQNTRQPSPVTNPKQSTSSKWYDTYKIYMKSI